jgi:hypothetical protein
VNYSEIFFRRKGQADRPIPALFFFAAVAFSIGVTS